MSVIEILPGLWFGDQMAVTNAPFLEQKHITFLINCSSFPRPTETSAMFFDAPNPDTNMVSQLCQLIYRQIDTHNILVYCDDGRWVSPMIIANYLVKYAQMSLEEAVDAIQSKYDNAFT
jgi:hypothetical protein